MYETGLEAKSYVSIGMDEIYNIVRWIKCTNLVAKLASQVQFFFIEPWCHSRWMEFTNLTNHTSKPVELRTVSCDVLLRR